MFVLAYDDLYYLEEAKDKLEEINDKLDLFNDLDNIKERITDLYAQEEVLSEYQQEENRTYGKSYNEIISNTEREENNIKNLFNTLKSI